MTRLDLPDNARALLDAVVAISSDLELHTVLDRIVVAACRITGAQYGALGVLGNDRTLVDFVTHGVDEALREKIGDLPSEVQGRLLRFLQEKTIGRGRLRTPRDVQPAPRRS